MLLGKYGEEGMETKMKTIVGDFIGTTIGIRSEAT